LQVTRPDREGDDETLAVAAQDAATA
jgi:hypothetical protein